MATLVQTKLKTRKNNNLRYSEYYDQQNIRDELYVESVNGKIFDNLMPLITSQKNILNAYRAIKGNKGSMAPGTDNLTIKDIEELEVDELVAQIHRRFQSYRPKAVRRKEIPKPNGKTRPLGIPCIWDRLIQQCILQILEPICEAKFSDNSYGFRPLRSAENAIASVEKQINLSKLHYIVEVDIKSFFDEVNHSKLMRQIWAMGIRDLKLISVILAILKAPIQMPDGTNHFPEKGTPQGGILSPLLANIVLNELDQWVDSQWTNNPVTQRYFIGTNANGTENKGSGYRAMKNTNLKEVHIIRYADDVRILCGTRSQANRMSIAVKQWLEERLKLKVSEEKTRVVNLKKNYSEFLGFKMKVVKKANKRVVNSHMCDKAIKSAKAKLKEQIKKIQHPKQGEQVNEICKYNAMERGMHNHYEIATHANTDFGQVAWDVNHTIQRLKLAISKNGAMGKRSQDYKKYGKSKQLRFIGSQWILPIGDVKHKNPMNKKVKANLYTKEGRAEVHDMLAIHNKWIMTHMAENPVRNRSTEYNDNRISLFAAQWGKCAITGRDFLLPDEVHCHHKKPCKMGGNDKYANLVLVTKEAHIPIHATKPETINGYLKILNLNSGQKEKLNNLRIMAVCEPV